MRSLDAGHGPILCLVLFGMLMGPALPALAPVMVTAQVGDWIIDGPGFTIENEIKEYSSSIIIENEGSLLISNSTVTFDLDVNTDGSKGIVVKSGGSLVIRNSEITSKSPSYRPTFESWGQLTIEKGRMNRIWGSWDDGGGVRIRAGNVVITDTTFKENERDGVTVLGGQVSILRSTFTKNVVGVRCKDAEGTLIEDNLFSENSQQGMILIGSSSVMKRNELRGNNIGIALSGSDVTIKDSEITGNQIGIDVADGTRATIGGNKVMDNVGAGIRIRNSTADIDDNNINSNGDGIDVTGSTVTITSNDIIGNENGISVSGTGGKVQGNVLGSNSGYGIYSVGRDITVHENDFIPSNAKGRVAIAWIFQIYVEKDGEPLKDADVSIYDRNDNLVHSGWTNASGLSDVVELVEEVVDNGGETIENTPHKLKVKYKKDKGTKKVKVTENQTYEVILEAEKEEDAGMLFKVMLGVGVSLIVVSIIMAIHLRRKGPEGPKPKSKREKRSKRSRRSSARSRSRSTTTGGRRTRRPSKKRRKKGKGRRRRH